MSKVADKKSGTDKLLSGGRLCATESYPGGSLLYAPCF